MVEFFEDDQEAFLVTRLCKGGDLQMYMEARDFTDLTESRLKQIAKGIASGLSYLHLNHIIHRDIKPENVLLMANWDLKIGDWGIAVQEIDVSKLDIDTIEKTAKAGSGEGTPIYMAPEIAKINRYIYDMKLFNAKAARIGQEVKEILIELHNCLKNSIPGSE